MHLHPDLASLHEQLSESLLEDVLDHAAFAIVVYAPVYDAAGVIEDFEVVRCTQRFFKNGWYSNADVGQRLSVLYPFLRGNGILESYRKVAETGIPWETDYLTYQHPYRWLHLFVTVMHEEFLVVTHTDITQRKQLEERLRKRAGFISAVSKTTPDLLYVFDPDTEAVFYSNGKISSLLGYTEAEALEMGNHIARCLLHPGCLPAYHALLEGLRHAPLGQVRQETLRLRRADGTYLWVSVRYVPFLKDEAGLTRQVLGLITDVHEKKCAEELLTKVLETSLAGLAVFRALRNDRGRAIDLAYVLVNSAGEKIVGKPRHELVGKRVGDLFPGVAETGLLAEYLRVVETGEPFRREFYYENDGFTNWFKIEAVAVGDGLALSIEDITGRKRDEEALHRQHQDLLAVQAQLHTHLEQLEARVQDRTRELWQANQELTAANAELDTFTYMASHDLKAPVASIEGIARYLKDNPAADPRETAAWLDLILKSVNQFNQTLHRMHEGIHQRQQREAARETGVRPVTERVTGLLREKIAASGATFHEDYPVTHLPLSEKDLQCILSNLLSNALKYGRPGQAPVIHLRTYRLGKRVVLHVEDNGAGMNARQVRKLFTPFARFHRHVEGTGLGLHLVKRIVDQQGGRIRVESREGVGTTFRLLFRLPEAQAC